MTNGVQSLACRNCGQYLSDEQMTEACRVFLDMQDAMWTSRWSKMWDDYEEVRDQLYHKVVEAVSLEDYLKAAIKALHRYGGRRSKVYKALQRKYL